MKRDIHRRCMHECRNLTCKWERLLKLDLLMAFFAGLVHLCTRIGLVHLCTRIILAIIVREFFSKTSPTRSQSNLDAECLPKKQTQHQTGIAERKEEPALISNLCNSCDIRFSEVSVHGKQDEPLRLLRDVPSP